MKRNYVPVSARVGTIAIMNLKTEVAATSTNVKWGKPMRITSRFPNGTPPSVGRYLESYEI